MNILTPPGLPGITNILGSTPTPTSMDEMARVAYERRRREAEMATYMRQQQQQQQAQNVLAQRLGMPDYGTALGALQAEEIEQSREAAIRAKETAEFNNLNTAYDFPAKKAMDQGNKKLLDSIADRYIKSASPQARQYGEFLKGVDMKEAGETDFRFDFSRPESTELFMKMVGPQGAAALGAANPVELKGVFGDDTVTVKKITTPFGGVSYKIADRTPPAKTTETRKPTDYPNDLQGVVSATKDLNLPPQVVNQAKQYLNKKDVGSIEYTKNQDGSWSVKPAWKESKWMVIGDKSGAKSGTGRQINVMNLDTGESGTAFQSELNPKMKEYDPNLISSADYAKYAPKAALGYEIRQRIAAVEKSMPKDISPTRMAIINKRIDPHSFAVTRIGIDGMLTEQEMKFARNLALLKESILGSKSITVGSVGVGKDVRDAIVSTIPGQLNFGEFNSKEQLKDANTAIRQALTYIPKKVTSYIEREAKGVANTVADEQPKREKTDTSAPSLREYILYWGRKNPSKYGSWTQAQWKEAYNAQFGGEK